MKKLIQKLKKKDVPVIQVETDSIPSPPREQVAAPIAIPRDQLSVSHSVHPSSEGVLSANGQEGLNAQQRSQSCGAFDASSALPPSHVMLGYRSNVPHIQLSVSNSTGFHIGSVQNIHVSNGSVAHLNSPGNGLSDLGPSLNGLQSSPNPKGAANVDSLEYVYDKIKDWELSLISEHASPNWKAFGLGLNRSQQELDSLENSRTPQQAILEILRNFIQDFPDTSVGFIASVLRETGHSKAVEQLAKLFKMYLDVDCWHAAAGKVSTAWLILLLLEKFQSTYSASQSQINEHLERGRELLARGQLQEALSQYHAAVEGDPKNYLTLYKRGTVYLALGRTRQGVADLDRVLLLKPDFYTARLQRGNILLKQAKLDEAEADFRAVLNYDPNNVEAYDNFYKLGPISEDLQLVRSFPPDSEHQYIVSILDKLIEACPWSSELREMRADRNSAMGNIEDAIADIRSTTKLEADNTKGFYKLSMFYYNQGETAESLKEIRECLKLDPEHRDCFPHYKKVKKADKLIQDMEMGSEAKQYDQCIEAAKKILLLEKNVKMIQHRAHSRLCTCYLKNDQPALSIASCTNAIKLHEDAATYCDRAEAYLSTEQYDDAIHDYHKAMELDDTFQRAREGIQRAQRMQKQSEKRDYYKILGVSRSATKKDIVKAYRSLAQKWHPDKFENEVEKKKAEKRFMDIAAAKEVLTDPEKKEKFDNGEDPLDPESGRYGGGNGGFPFNQGFHHFHGSPFQFKFHFS